MPWLSDVDAFLGQEIDAAELQSRLFDVIWQDASHVPGLVLDVELGLAELTNGGRSDADFRAQLTEARCKSKRNIARGSSRWL